MSMWYATVGAGDTKRQRERQREWQIINTCNLNDAVKESGDNCRENKLQRNIRMCSRHCRIMNTVNIHSIAPFLGGLFVYIYCGRLCKTNKLNKQKKKLYKNSANSFVYSSWEPAVQRVRFAVRWQDDKREGDLMYQQSSRCRGTIKEPRETTWHTPPLQPQCLRFREFDNLIRLKVWVRNDSGFLVWFWKRDEFQLFRRVKRKEALNVK